MGRLILQVDHEAFCAAVKPRGHSQWRDVRWWPGNQDGFS
jgi:hypothetical protein